MSANAPYLPDACVRRLEDPALVAAVTRLVERFGLALRLHPHGSPLPGSYWGEPEAGLTGGVLHVRTDTPLHSALHEACHYVCMAPGRRAGLDTDAGGDYDEENAVCRLQILLSGELPGTGPAAMCADMDAWGYTFRLGSAARWYAEESADALAWLVREGIVDATGRPTWRCRGSVDGA